MFFSNLADQTLICLRAQRRTTSFLKDIGCFPEVKTENAASVVTSNFSFWCALSFSIIFPEVFMTGKNTNTSHCWKLNFEKKKWKTYQIMNLGSPFSYIPCGLEGFFQAELASLTPHWHRCLITSSTFLWAVFFHDG